MPRPVRTLVLGDLHLTRQTPRAVSDDLAALLAAHPGERVVFAGDLFDLSAESPKRPHAAAMRDVLSHHAAAGPALARHVDGGGELWLVGGNHDADVAIEAFRDAFGSAVGIAPEARARMRWTPWFFREGAVHIEHGHLYDPDNAPAHPLVVGEASLGVHFVEEFIAPTGAFAYLNSNDQTPLKLFLSSFTLYGPRAPHVIYRYFHAAFAAMLKSGPLYRAGHETREGDERTARFAEEVGLPRDLVDEVAKLGARPTLESLSRTFTRLYFDRVIATITMGGGLGALALGHRKAGATAFATGAALMTGSWSRGHDRYQGTVADRLGASAQRVAEATGAKLVLFGHTHQEAQQGTYANTGSFAFPRTDAGRPFLEIVGSEGAPRAERRHWRRAA